MEIQGRIIAVLDKQSGVSSRTGSAWASQEYVLENHDQYPRKCCFRVFGEDKINNMNIQVGEELTVSFDIDAREYNGRWYNTLSAWKVDRTPVVQPDAAGQPVAAPAAQQFAQPTQPTQPAAPAAQPAVSADPFADDGSADGLPF
ncbi:MAG: DUF3127 domain-containing protein [Bacteroidaceae bacterium]|nr:DUF3127 domain-containing protein [Bacteroidaceae bacterium]